ncbi:RimJ/RimL family protein N-acetyltransferase [Virgibacillus natechei]|uniref:RimJ/RimL family protein N-acetyltransferase n=1 Tax=Virgibacillus natechei TaxID=1216297 RepID=A0ABS4IIA4_9BACI|nr:GNAT family N-acetyltransferase [Virgibacillus natechei]MBP1970693.1 RimJ/RimL family protein N-acetyltransferase [Virgibacillus natechei]UZD12062.1 GNAT family N-acetyltransferase [Virgibacillus natechei]
MDNILQPTPWDKRNFHIDTYQLTTTSLEALEQTNEVEGHFTLKVDPFENKENLLKYGFYYVDTLIEPVGKKENLQLFEKEGIRFSRDYDKTEILEIATEAFTNGRFHRDFNIPDYMADRRYKNWVNDLIEKDIILALHFEGRTAGFFAYEDDKILLLGIHKDFRGRGLAKAFTSHCVQEQFKLSGYDTLKTSISPVNLASLNVFIALGFRLKNTVDVYHKLHGSLPVGG